MSDLDRTDHRPADSVGGGLQHERTALAWERTAFSIMVAGILLARFLSSRGPAMLGGLGVAATVGGGALLLWANRNHAMLHDPTLPASAVPQVRLTRLIGSAAVAITGVALVMGLVYGNW